jgi:hypothetical protein
MATDTTAQQMLADLKREKFLEKADFSTPFASENRNLPLGETPMLVTDVQLTLHNSGSLILLFQDKSGDSASGASCEFNLRAALLHGLLHLIEQSLKKAQWQQPDFSQRTEQVESPQSERLSYRH